jgi:trehalose 6-phosphate phosphatase
MPLINIQTVLSQPPRGLVFDIDGTLSPIAPTPEEARLYPGVVALLEQARERANVAIMTGRAIDDGARMVNVEGLTYIGNHGLEWSDGLPWMHQVHMVQEALDYVEPGRQLLDLAENGLAGIPGIIVQRKSVGGSIHYRLAPDHEEARQSILSLLEEPAQKLNMRLGEGKQVVEIRAPLAVNKGFALGQFVQRLDLRSVIFAGDDRTDFDALMEVSRLRNDGIAALSVVVQYADTLPELLEHADIVVQGVEGMVELLREIVAML